MTVAPVTYRIHPLTLRLRCDRPALAEHVARILGPFAVDDDEGEGEAYDLRVLAGAVDESAHSDAGLAELWRGLAPNGLEFSYYAGPQVRQIVSPGVLAARVDLVRREATMIVSPDRPWAAAYGGLTPLLTEMLYPHGHYGVHLAAVAAGADDDAPAVLLCAPSGYGKTTTALALRSPALHLVCDDAGYLLRADGQVRLWGLPRPAKASGRTYELLAELAELPSRASHTDGERQIDMAELQPDWRPRRVTPRAVVILAKPNERAHRLEPIDPLEALGQLAANNVHAVQHAAGNPAGDAFRILVELTRQCRTLRLSAGPAPQTLPELMAPLLADRP